LKELNDTYRTIENAPEPILFKEKNSKFYGYAFPIQREDEVKPIIEVLKKSYPTARHFCYAYQLGAEKTSYRANDDGEPSNSAGMPIYGQLQSFDVTNILVVVVRLFGGTKLGVGGLIAAYRTAAQLTLENSIIAEKTIDICITITYDYIHMNKVMRVIKEKALEITTQEIEMDEESGLPKGVTVLKVRKKNAESIFDIFNSIYEIKIKTTE
jgi:uncharacterized YigZ family protein